ncbi:MAG: 2-C-methyl-D-erythritol 4-phosphate cytidylyltransferase [Bacteroidales bacterium]|nr:2-C-methyl-D-erythritol 4-phosphate cytidylyltransferase [Bacteroidales bacterium]
MQNFVAILAAGKGSRMGLSQPKQFEMLNGKTILEHSVDTFEKHPNIHGIYVVVHRDFIDNTRRLLNIRNRPKIIEIIAGGEERTDSSYAAISAIESHVGETPRGRPMTDCNLLIHDAARPFITHKIITRTIDALKNHSAVSVAIPATDTIYICDNENKIESSPKRDRVYLAQTPQAARLSIFKQAFELTRKNPQHIATDDANVILNYFPEVKIHIVLGDIINRKITFKEDLKER